MRLRVCSRREAGAGPARGATESLTRWLLPQTPTKSRSPLSLPAPGRSLDGGHHEGGSTGSPGEVSGGDERASNVAPGPSPRCLWLCCHSQPAVGARQGTHL